MLSQQEKDALYDHFHGEDLYDPSKAPEQDPVDFSPKCEEHGGAHTQGMCNGGQAYSGGGMVAQTDFESMSDLLGNKPTHKGMVSGIHENYARGGPVRMDEGGDVPQLDPSGMTGGMDPYSMDPKPPADKPNDATIPGMDGMANYNTNSVLKDAIPQAQPMTPATSQAPQGGPPDLDLGDMSTVTANPPQAATNTAGLQPDQYAQLVKALTARPSIGQSIASGVGGLADGIMQGVARAGNPGFQKNITEQQQNQKQALIAALEAKYKGQGLNLEKGRLDEEVRQHNIEGDLNKNRLGFEQSKQTQDLTLNTSKAKVEAAQKIIEAYEKGNILSSARPSKAEYQQAKNVLKSSGGGASAGGETRKTPSGVTYTVNQ